jgi:hypothetical protein
MLQRFLRREEEPEDVQVELLVEVLLGDVFERRELVDAGIVHQDVERAERLLRLGEQALDVRLSRDIGLHRNGLAALAGDLGHHAVGAVLAGGVVDDDRRAFIRQMLGDGGANPLGCPGHDRHLVRELAHVLVPHVRLRPPVAVGIAVKTCVILPLDAAPRCVPFGCV